MDLMPGHIPTLLVQPRTKGSLLAAAMPGQSPEGVDWHKGVITWPDSAPSWRVVQDCTDAQVVYGDEVESLPVSARPFVIQTVTSCPRTSIEAMAARAERHLRTITSTALSHELWYGEATALDPWTLPTNQALLGNQRPDAGTADEGPYLNPHLAAATAPTMTATTIEEAIGVVEGATADQLAGGPTYIHVPRSHIMELQYSLETQGDLLLTRLGSYVVADAGYPPNVNDPTGTPTDLTVYATGPIQYWLDEPVVYDQSSWVVDHTNNRMAVWAERAALLLFDPQTLVGCTVTG